MKKILLTNLKNFALVILLLLAICLHLFAAPTPTPSCPIVTERFQGLGDGATANNSSTGWNLDASNVSGGIFAVKSNRFHAQEIGGEGKWYTKVFSTTGYTDFQVAVKISSEGDMNSTEYVRVYYKINGGAETMYASNTGNFGTLDFISPALNGNNVQIIVRMYNYNNGGSQTSKYYIEEYRVFKEHGPCAGGIPVSASAGNGGVLTCTTPSLTLSASTSVTGTTTWSWSGPNSFSSTSQNPSVSTAGTYTVTATNASGTGTATVTVSENKTAPTVTATGGSLGCAGSVTLGATSNISGSVFSWTGPNGFTSSAASSMVTAAGTYTVNVTNPANGCTTSRTATVTAGTSAPVTLLTESFTLANNSTASGTWSSVVNTGSSSSVFSVQNNEFRVNNITATGEGVWNSGNINITGKNNILISAGVRSGVVNGGALENSGSSLDYIRLFYKIDNGPEVLFAEYLGTINSNSATNTSASGSVSGSGTNLQFIIRSKATATDELYYFDNISITGMNSGATITSTVNGPVTCTSNAQLSAIVSGGTVTGYAWTGPNGFSSSSQNPTVSAGGQYTVTATLSGGACAISSVVNVVENKTAPVATATGGALTCAPGITISASSSIGGSTFAWTGPNGFISNSATPYVTAAGTYTVTVTNPANGCTDSEQVSVTQSSLSWVENFSQANGTNVDNDATPWSVSINPSTMSFAVNSNEFRVSNSTTTGEGVWRSGVINITGINSVNISFNVRSSIINGAVMNTTGEYADYIRFYYKLNNGSEVLFAERAGIINNHSTTPASVSVSSLSGSSLQIVVRARATGDDEFYYFDNVQVTGAAQAGFSATASLSSPGAILTCTNTSISLSGNASTTGVSYSWTGPNGFSSSLQNPSVNAPGLYTLTATAAGCTASDTVMVSQNVIPPANVTTNSTTGGSELTCLVGGLTLVGSSTTPGFTYSWTMPNGVSVTSLATGAVLEGNYIFRATNPVNGCTASDTFTVVRNMATPVNASIVKSGTSISCTNSSVTLTASNSLNVTYNWIGPNGFTASGPVITVTEPGTYNVIMAHPITGCNHTIAEVVNNSVAIPNVSIGTSPSNGQLTCTVTSISLTGSSSTPGVQYAWSGPGQSASTPGITVNAPGTYTVTATDPSNGCSTSTSKMITIDNTPPAGVTATFSDVLTCITTMVDLTGTSSTPGATYAWSGPGDFAASTAITQTDDPGNYQLRVTNPANGCVRTVLLTVEQDIAPPADAEAFNLGPLTCTINSVMLIGSTSASDVDYLWTGPGNFVSFSPTPFVSEPGTYTLTITDLATNGCSATVTTTVLGDFTGCSSDKGGVKSSEVKGGTINKAPVTVLEHKAFPNPFRENVFIEFQSPTDDVVKVEFYNSSGVLQKVLFNDRVKGGNLYKINVSSYKLPQGAYYYIIRNGHQKMQSGKILLIR